ncbi:MAG: MmcQ/YjbR family DNA-binding protein [Lachnospiraceae bacterium]
MKYEWLEEFCLAQEEAVQDYKEEWGATRYMIDGKMFAMCGTDKSGRAIITLKLEPAYGQMLRDQYPDIVPGYYMNKVHWSSVYLDGAVPDELLKTMIGESHQLIFRAKSKKKKQ